MVLYLPLDILKDIRIIMCDLNHIMKLIDTIQDSERVLLRQRIYHKGDFIARENDRCEGIFIINKGKIKISSYSLGGKEIIYNMLSQDDVFGNNLVFSSSPYYRGNVIAETEVSLSYIYNKDIEHLFQTNLEFVRCYLQIQSDFGKTLNAKLKLLSFPLAEERIFFLLESSNGEIEYNTMTDLANLLFLTREVTSRTVHRLAKENKIILGKHKISLA